MASEQETIKSLLQIKQQKYNGEEIHTVNARQLFAYLGYKSNYTTWFKRVVDDYDFVEAQDFFPFLEESSMGRPMQNHAVTIDMAKELCMLSKGDKGKEARKYFIACEKKLKEVVTTPAKQIEAGEQTAKFFNNLLDDVNRFSPTARQVVAVDIAKKIYGIELPYTALPAADERYSATELAQRLSEDLDQELTPNFIGRIINKLNLRRPPFAARRLSKALHCNKEIEQYFYQPVVLEKIKDYLEQ